MAKRRMISENLLYDPIFNSLTVEAQNLFVRTLIKTDDYGILPADQWSMLNLSKKMDRKLETLIGELTQAGLVQCFLYEEKPFLAFKRDRFDEYQSYLIQKRTKSEYLRLESKVMDGRGFQEILGKSWKFSRVTPVTHKEYKVTSSKYKDQEKEGIVFKDGKLTIPESLKEEFCGEFGRTLVDQQILKMEGWLKFNKPKKDYKRFIFNWLNRARTTPATVATTPTARPNPNPTRVRIDCDLCNQTHYSDENCKFSVEPTKGERGR